MIAGRLNGSACRILRVDDHFRLRTTKQNVQPIHNITSENPLRTFEIDLKSTRMFLPIEENPGRECQCSD
jgi:hypothetical protein